MFRNANSHSEKMTKFLLIELFSVFCLGVFNPQACAKDITLADPTASASVIKVGTPERYEIALSFVPVTTLDAVSNEEMTDVLAQFYAEEAISLFMGVPKAIVRDGAKASKGDVAGGKIKWFFTVPKRAIVGVSKAEVDVRSEWAGAICYSRVDIKTRLEDFRSQCFRDLRVAEMMFDEKIQHAKTESEKRFLCNKAKHSLDELRLKIKADSHLFRAEKAKMLKKCDEVEEYLNSSRQKCIADLPIKNAKFDKEIFEDLIKEDTILLTHGGARIKELDDGSVAVISVGSAAATMDDCMDIAEMDASAALSKLLGGEETVVRNELRREYSRVGKSEIQSEMSEFKRKSLIQLFSTSYHKSGETVGTWLSLDGKRFFVAKGRVVSKEEQKKSLK